MFKLALRWQSKKLIALAVIIALGVSAGTWSELNAGNNRQSAVGGVSINAAGILANVKVADLNELRAFREKMLEQVPGEIKQWAPLRKLSLRRLEAAIAEHRKTQVTPLPEEIQYLGGLQQIKYVFVYPEQNDIVLVGPAEGWKVDGLGNMVGITTNRPVLELDDLLVALRSGGRGALQCSIDPTPEGLKKLQATVSKLKTIGSPRQTFAKIEEALGPQVVSVGGVPNTSHFARVMVAADFRMKRMAMNFEQAPIADLPSYLHLAKAGRAGLSNMLPRWWLAPKADPVLADANGLAWELQGLTVQCKTEEDFLAADGSRKRTGKAGGVAKRWADNFTSKFDELSKKDTVFGQLRNLMDLAVVSALIRQENLLDRVELSIPYLAGEELIETYNAPRHVATKASFLKKGRNWLISASGGVQMFPSQLAAKKEMSETLSPLRAKATGTGNHWWWN